MKGNEYVKPNHYHHFNSEIITSILRLVRHGYVSVLSDYQCSMQCNIVKRNCETHNIDSIRNFITVSIVFFALYSILNARHAHPLFSPVLLDISPFGQSLIHT